VLVAISGGALLGRARRAAAAPEAIAVAAYLGEIRMFAGNFAPSGWALCNGQLLAIGQNTALFSLLGTSYGGNGVSTFGLPDLRGRVVVQPGQGPGLSLYDRGQTGGAESYTLPVAEMPSHTHTLRGTSSLGDSDSPAGRVMARDVAGIPEYSASTNGDMAAAAITSTGGGAAHNNMAPYRVVNFIIALEGVFPPHQ